MMLTVVISEETIIIIQVRGKRDLDNDHTSAKERLVS